MKKIGLFIVILFFLSGCSVKYEINIDKDYIKENVTIIGDNAQDNISLGYYNDPIPAFINSPVASETPEKVPGVAYYNTIKNNDELGNVLLNLKYDFKLNEYKDNYLISNSVSNFYYYNNDGTITINTGLFIKAFEYNNGISKLDVIINISDDYEIISSNASQQNGNTLTWEVLYENRKKSPINLKIKAKNSEDIPSGAPNQNNNPTRDEEQNNQVDTKSILIIVGSLSLFLIFLGVMIKIKNAKNN